MKNKTFSELGSFLKLSREAANLTQAEVAQRLGHKALQSLSNWEIGARSPPLNVLSKLAVMYKVDLEIVFDILLRVRVNEVRKQLTELFEAG